MLSSPPDAGLLSLEMNTRQPMPAKKTVDAFISRVGTVWPRPFIETGTGKGRFRAWRKIDLDKAIGVDENADPEVW